MDNLNALRLHRHESKIRNLNTEIAKIMKEEYPDIAREIARK